MLDGCGGHRVVSGQGRLVSSCHDRWRPQSVDIPFERSSVDVESTMNHFRMGCTSADTLDM